MFDWLRNWWQGILFWWDLTGKVASAITRVVQIFVDHFYQWWGAAANWAKGFFHISNRLWFWAVSVFLTLEHIAFDLLPRKIRDITRTITNWVGDQLQRLKDLVQGWVDGVFRWARDELGHFWNWFTGLITDISRGLGDLWNRFLLIERRVVALLTHPEELATWLAAEIGKAVWKWAVPLFRSWGGFVLRHALPVGLYAAKLVEQILVDVFG